MKFKRCKFVFIWLTAVLCGCSSMQYRDAQSDFRSHVEKSHYIENVPVIPQQESQCGPASLATILRYKGVSVSADELKHHVYLPEAGGSLQAEMVASARQSSLIPYSKKSSFSELFTEIYANQPVLVLLNLGLESLPTWHYAVVVGVNKEKNSLVLHAGKPEAETMGLKRFEYAWRQSGYWSLSVHKPSALPSYADDTELLLSIAKMEELHQLDTAQTAYLSAHAIWPVNPAPLVGLGNIAYRQEEFELALRYFTKALPLSKTPQPVQINMALTLLKLGDKQQALTLLREVDNNESTSENLAIYTKKLIKEVSRSVTNSPESERAFET